MATSLTISGLKASIAWNYTSTDALGNYSTNSASLAYSKSLAEGTGAGYAQKFYFDKFTLAASGTTTRDVSGSLTDVFGNAVVFTKIKAIYCEVTTDGTGGPVVIGGGTDGSGTNGVPNWVASNTDKIRVRNGGAFFLSCTDATGYAVTAATGDILRFENESGAASCIVKVVIVGE